MITEKSKAKLTPEEIKDQKKREMFQRIFWSGALEPIEQELGGKILNGKMETERGRMETSIRKGADNRWELVLDVFLGEVKDPRLEVMFGDDGKIRVASEELRFSFAKRKPLYVDHKPNIEVKLMIELLLGTLPYNKPSLAKPALS